MASTQLTQIRHLPVLVPLLRRQEGFAEVVACLTEGQSGNIDGTWGSSCALAAATIAQHAPGTILVVMPRISELDDFAADWEALTEREPVVFPAWDSLPDEHDVADTVFGRRLRCLSELESSHPAKVVLTSFPALMQPVPSRELRESQCRTFSNGEEIDLDEVAKWLVSSGFERVTAIELPGEFTIHGGILDIFPADTVYPIRIELFGDEIDSMRSFDVESQRKISSIEQIKVSVVSPAKMGDGSLGEATLADSLPENTWVVLFDLVDLANEGKHYLQRLDNPKGLFTPQAALKSIAHFPSVTISAIGHETAEQTCRLKTESIERFAGQKQEVLRELETLVGKDEQILRELETLVGKDEQILLCCHNEGERQRLEELFQETVPELVPNTTFCVGGLSRGFRLVNERLVVLSDHELFGRRDIRPASRKSKLETRAIDSFLELSDGDLVVHVSHGIGRFLGMELVENNGISEEHLILEFADKVKIYVPSTLIHLVQKYVGATKAMPRLSKLGSASWSKKKARVAQAVADMASDMIHLQAERAAKPGIAFPPDSHWYHEFEAAFPYDATPDQATAIDQIRNDMLRPRPMDRLICGDVGYGKTEVAMRAAFRAIDAGKQVVVLVPTTVLAEQHYRSFTQRMAEYPLNIDVLSRFRSKKEQKNVLQGLADGSIDLVIGTHRLVQKDVRLKDLGLLIIDEEQRFGVDAKEMLKRLRLEVDVLTLSATPIPRTLHMSLLGIRDISNLLTPPRERQAIETRISRFDRELIRQAIVRELNRGGQVYFVHNRVYNIRSIADTLQTIVPEATVAIVHGQMPEGELEREMVRFVTGKADILVATTIIESGLDIPNANTIFIHQADRYGLADLHQLRGRVGRDKHRAYCYLLLEEGKSLTSVAMKRLKAIEEFSDLGAGFKISMRDLEIRGAGNILGTEQSGHISSVGYELYCHLLENAVRRQKNEPLREHPHVNIDLPVSAYLPGDYVPPGRHKIEMYRKLSALGTIEQLVALRDELRDRFGPIPKPALLLLNLKEIQVLARFWQIDGIRLESGFVVFSYRNSRLINTLKKHHGSEFRIVDKNHVYYVCPKGLEGQPLLTLVKSVLRAT